MLLISALKVVSISLFINATLFWLIFIAGIFALIEYFPWAFSLSSKEV